MQKLSQWFNNDLPKYLMAAVLIIVPLFPKFPLFAIPGTYVAIRFEDLILVVLGIVTFLKIIRNPKNFFKDELVVAFLIFFGVNLVSLLSGIFLTKTVSLHIGFLNYLRRVEYLVPLFAILTLFTKEQINKNLNYFVKILIIVTIVACLYGLGERYLSFPIITTQNDQYAKGVALRWSPGSHISSTFAGHYDLAAFMVMVLPIFITLFFTIKEKWNKIWLFLTIGGGLWLLINSLSRISQVSYLIAVTIALIISRKFKSLALVLIVSIVLIGQSSSLYARFDRVIEVFYKNVQRIVHISFKPSFVVHAESTTIPTLRSNLPKPTTTPVPVFEDRSTSIRLNVEWPRAIRAFEINPFLGTGYSSISLATDNDFLRMLGETGILGLFAFFLIFMKIGKLFIKAIPKLKNIPEPAASFIIGILGAIIGTFISSLFIDLFEASKFATIFWLLVGYVVYLIRNYAND